PRDRLARGARRARQAHQRASLPAVRRRAASPRGAPRTARRPDALRHLALAASRDPCLFPAAHAAGRKGADRRAHRARDRQSPGVPGERRLGLPRARALRAADHIVDMGPGAGEAGGQVIAQGALADILANARSLTGRYLAGELSIALPAHRRRPTEKRIVVSGARGNNLKDVELSLPLGLLACVTGVSGSGKSTLINDTLYAAVARSLYGSALEPAPHDSVSGLEQLDKVISVDQSPIG